MRVFKACAVRETAVYWSVNEDFEDKRNAENTFLDDFYFFSGFEIVSRICVSAIIFFIL